MKMCHFLHLNYIYEINCVVHSPLWFNGDSGVFWDPQGASQPRLHHHCVINSLTPAAIICSI